MKFDRIRKALTSWTCLGVLAAFALGLNVYGITLVIGRSEPVLHAQSPNAERVWVMGSGATGLKYSSVGTTEDEHAVSASPGRLLSIVATNTNAAARYIRCADATAANTAPGTTTPIVDLAIPAAGQLSAPMPYGLTVSTALTCWLTVGAASSSVDEVAANEIKVLYTFKLN